MPRFLNRRSFINSILLLFVAPPVTSEKSQLIRNQYQIYSYIKQLDDGYFSVNGWVVPKETLTKGVR